MISETVLLLLTLSLVALGLGLVSFFSFSLLSPTMMHIEL